MKARRCGGFWRKADLIFELTINRRCCATRSTRYLRERDPFHAAGRARRGDDASLWRALAGISASGAPFPVEAGGLGGGAVERRRRWRRSAERWRSPPYLETVVLAGALLRQVRGDRDGRCSGRWPATRSPWRSGEAGTGATGSPRRRGGLTASP
ncbi:hypothetical protein AB5I41_08460 [Sphingomonas sp. MMS24-JH45]